MLGKVSEIKKKSMEFSITGGRGGSTPFLTFLFMVIQIVVKNCVFYVPIEVKST